MRQDEWSSRLVARVAEAIRAHRGRRDNMSAQQLSDACSRLGHPIPRSVLTNIENGRRETVTLAEWLVLAAALRVPPLLLVFPVGRVDVVEPLPGFEVDPLTALHWAETGQLPAPAPCLPERPADEDARLIERYRRHRELVSAWRMASGSADAVRRHWSGDERDAELARLEREQRVIVGALRDLRDLLRSQGLILPELSPAALRESVAEDEKRIES